MKDLSKYNYDDIVEKVTDILKNKDGWGDAYQSSMGQTLIQLLADTTDNLHYLLERRTTEGFLHHARLESSVIARASELGYRPLRANSNTGTLQMTFLDKQGRPSPPIFEVFIPKNTKFSIDGRSLYSVDDTWVLNPNKTAEIMAREGEYKSQTVDISELTDSNEILIRDWRSIDEYSLIVKVGGEVWEDVRSLDDANKRALSFVEKDGKFYDLRYSVEGMYIVFGDNWFGKRPDQNIEISYIEVSTVEPIMRTGRTVEVSGQIVDYRDNTIIYDVEIINKTPITGAKSSESIDSVRKNATTYNQTNGRGVTNTDYSFWVKRSGVGEIVDANAYGEEEIDTYIYNANNVYIAYARADYGQLTTPERSALRQYLNNIKTTQAHLVLKRANPVELVVSADVKIYNNIPMSASHSYFTLKRFIDDQFAVKQGAIGRTYHKSDVVHDFYSLKYDDGGIKKPLVDFVKFDMELGAKFNFPSPVRSAIVGIEYTEFDNLQVGTEWVVVIDDRVCKVTVGEGETISSLLLKMRDTIRKFTDVTAIITIEGGAVDSDGNLIPIEVQPDIGYHLLIGKENSNRDIDDVVQPVDIGRTVVLPKLTADHYSIQHFYYKPKAGWRPTIPIRNSTTIEYTPVGTDMEVWIKKSYIGQDDYALHKIVKSGETFLETFTDNQLLKFKLLNDSPMDTIATITYSSWEGSKIGLKLEHVNRQSKIDIDISSGYFGGAGTAFINYEVIATRPKRLTERRQRIIHPNSVRIITANGEEVCKDNGVGKFVGVHGGYIDYVTGIISPPPSLYDNTDYIVLYKQDEYDNFELGDGDVVRLSELPLEKDGEGLSKLKIV